MDKVVFLESGATLTLATNPSQGKTLLVIAVGEVAAVLGGAFPITGGNLSLPKDSSVMLVFDTANAWVPSTQSEGTSTAGQEPAWFIDEQNGTGNASDANSGTTAAAPLLTHTELERRLKGAFILPPTVSIPVPFPPFALVLRPWTCTLLSNCTTANPAGLQCTFGPDCIPQYVTPTATATSSGTFTGVVGGGGAVKRATNQRYEMTDAARIAPWEVKQRIRITSGPRTGAIAYIAEDLGGGTCVTSDWSIPIPYPFRGVTEITPVAGVDTYAVERLTEIALKGDWEIYRSGQNLVSPGVVGFVSLPYVGFTSLKIVNTPNSVTAFTNLSPMLFNKCQINPHFFAFTCAFTLNNTALLNGANFSTGGLHFMISGAVFDSGIPAGTAGSGGNSFGLTRELYVSQGAVLNVDADAMCYGGPEWHVGAASSILVGGFMAAFKAVAKAGHPTGFGMKVTPGCLVAFENRGLGGSRFWGNLNSKKGIYIEPLCTVAWGAVPATDLVPTVTGLTGVNRDFAIGLQTNEMSTTIDDAADPPVYLQKISNTWLALDTPAAIAGVAFGGNAIDAVGGGRIVKYPFIG